LKEICVAEGLNTDTRTLMALIDLTQGDIRSCINSLQYACCFRSFSVGYSLAFLLQIRPEQVPRPDF
jgi:DNA polymerase III delta prime subunit